ncbi:uncharacterized protein LOC126905897 [Daktulosphaira vitifoliae]|uniref:uncharacterized protein LOC126905897 n=1 Tax=Daktulosphaira vitifoliae TaxID=58002 RepID=UPI0021A9E9EB|nr:uncharacterized protein LOC126905897 [Daktulosphaira vitifoliae]
MSKPSINNSQNNMGGNSGQCNDGSCNQRFEEEMEVFNSFDLNNLKNPNVFNKIISLLSANNYALCKVIGTILTLRQCNFLSFFKVKTILLAAAAYYTLQASSDNNFKIPDTIKNLFGQINNQCTETEACRSNVPEYNSQSENSGLLGNAQEYYQWLFGEFPGGANQYTDSRMDSNYSANDLLDYQKYN